jgi:capsular polysaccharide biosynthesis protein
MTEELEQGGPAYFPQLEGVGPAVRLLDEPQPFPLIPGLRAQLLGPAVRVGLALAVGAGLALAYHYLDPSVREAHELEEMGLEVVGRIPRHRKGT